VQRCRADDWGKENEGKGVEAGGPRETLIERGLRQVGRGCESETATDARDEGRTR